MKEIAIIFDLNGTIADTETAYFEAYKKVLREYDIDFTIRQFTENWSTKGKKLKDYLIAIKREDLLPSVNEISSVKDAEFQNTLEERVILMKGAKEVLQRITDAGFRCGLDSSTGQDNIVKILKHLGVMHYFDAITSGDVNLDVQKYGPKEKKSSRLKFLADSLDTEVKKCVMVGDAEKDITGAKEAGMYAVAIPNVYTKDNDFSKADIIVDNLGSITPEMLVSFSKTEKE